ncbi:MAG TPA: hypothetical protein VM165_09730 [Planctomycetaceae bacterium]|nr:hypothetical protein [Planctomycetaceae bacterium]
MDHPRSGLTLRTALGLVAASMGLAVSNALPADEPRPTLTTLVSPRPAGGDDVDAAHYQAIRVAQPGSSSLQTRREALAELPLAGLTPIQSAKAQQVLNGLGLFRRLPTLAMEVDADVYRYLLSHPDVAVSTWRAMDISKFQLQPTAAGVYHADAGDGSVGTVEVWRSSAEETVIYCDGAFKSPLLARPIVARSIMRLKSRFYQDAEGTPHVEHTGDVFVEFPSQTVETVARVVSPVSHMIADRNFRQLTLYVHLMSQAMSRQPGWIRTIARRMDSSDEQRTEFLSVAEKAHAANERRLGASAEPLPVDAILAPLRTVQRPTDVTVR